MYAFKHYLHATKAIVWSSCKNNFFIFGFLQDIRKCFVCLQMSSANIDQEPPAKKQRIDSSQALENNSNSVQPVSIV